MIKKTPPWAPRFDERLHQSRAKKAVPKLKKKGYRLYMVYKKETQLVPNYVTIRTSLGYSFKMQYEEIETLEYQGVKWLKPKHVTLLRMQGGAAIKCDRTNYEQPPLDVGL
jgi:hypothetical protein